MNSAHKKTILLVEDEAITAMLEKKQLENMGYSVHHVSNGEDAIQSALNENYSLILMDIDLGFGIDGTQAAEQILNRKDVPVVFLSSHTEPEIVEKTEKITSYGYVVKNSGIVVLDTSIKMALKLFNAKTLNKQSEEELRKSHARMLAVFDGIEEPIYVSDPETFEILFVNRILENIFGEPGNRRCYEYLQGRNSPCPFCTNDLIFGENLGLTHLWEFRNESNGRLYKCIDRSISWPNGRNVRYEMAVDITERNRAEERLQQLSSIVEQAEEMIIYTDSEFNISYMNPAAERITGYALDEVKGKKPSLFSADPQNDARHEQFFALLQEGSINKQEYLNRHKNGSEYVTQASITPIRNDDKKIIGYVSFQRDTTELKKEEMLMAQTRNNYETFFNTIDDFLFVLDEQWNIIHANFAVIDRLGYSFEELRGKSALMAFPPERRNETGRILGAIINGSADFCFIPLITKSGVQIPVETRLSLGTWNGKAGIFGVSKDISRARLSEEKFSKLFHINPSACGLSDLEDHTYLEVNEAFCKLFGFEKKEVIGKSAVELGIITPNARNIVTANADGNGKIKNVEVDLKAKNGDIKHVMLSSENIFAQDKKYRFTVVHDMTDRKQLETLCRKNEEKYRLLVENTHDIIYSLTADGFFIFVSPAWSRLLGHATEKVEGHSFTEFVHPDDLPPCLLFLQKVLDTGERQECVEYRVRHADGHWLWHASNASPFFDAHGAVSGFNGIARDITERKRAEEKIQKQLSEKEILLREVHHRVKNNIATIESLLSLQGSSTAHPEVKTALKDAVSRVQSMRILYDKLLLSDDYYDISIKSYIENLIDSLLAVFVLKNNIVIHKQISEFNIISKKAISIGIIINELLTNVFKYAFKDRDNGAIFVSLNKTENMATLIIHDNGIGINERILENKSPGFGLTIVKMLVEQLKGTCSIANENGTKSVIQFEIEFCG